jgi:hypothetical protein
MIVWLTWQLFFHVAFFEQVHPVYPFLDRRLFEKRAFEPSSQSPARVDEVWLALYYTVLAIGCQYDDGGSFDRACGPAWKLFEIGLSYFPDIIMMKGSLVAVQVWSCVLHRWVIFLINSVSFSQGLTAMVCQTP